MTFRAAIGETPALERHRPDSEPGPFRTATTPRAVLLPVSPRPLRGDEQSPQALVGHGQKSPPVCPGKSGDVLLGASAFRDILKPNRGGESSSYFPCVQKSVTSQLRQVFFSVQTLRQRLLFTFSPAAESEKPGPDASFVSLPGANAAVWRPFNLSPGPLVVSFELDLSMLRADVRQIQQESPCFLSPPRTGNRQSARPA